jgi:hypothetical protein
MNLSRRIILTIKSVGFFATLFKIIKYPYIFFLRKVKIKKVLAHSSIKQRFTEIYHSNYWDDTHSLSGSGSNLKSTKGVIKQLPVLIKKFNINSILDAPCGDFYWMKNVLNKVNINYLGGDIVGKIVNSNNSKYKSKKINFTKINIISDALPSAQLMICRDCLFHFSYNDIFMFFKNFIKSNIKFLLVTSHQNDRNKFLNKDIITGDFRKIDLFSEQFNFRKTFIFSIKDKDELEISNYKYLYLFLHKDIKNFLENRAN